MATPIRRPATFGGVVNPFLRGNNSAAIGGDMNEQLMPQPVPNPLAGAPMRRVPTAIEPMQGLGPMGAPQVAAASAMPMPQGQPGGGFMSGLKGGLNDFLGGDASLAMAAGLLGGGSTSQAIGRGFGNALQTRSKPPSGADIQAFQFAKTPEGGGFQGSFVDFMKVGSTGEFGLTPVPYVREDGSVGYGVTTKSGQFKPLDVPGEGIMSPYRRRLDESSGGEAGKAKGGAEATYNSMISKMPGLEQVVSSLDKLAETATYTSAGQIRDQLRLETGQEPTQSAIDRATYISMVNNQILPLLRDTFGSQFTEREGATLRETLGDPNLQPEAKKAVLKSFIEQKRRDVKAVAQQAGIDTPVPGALDPAIEDLVRTYGG